MSGRKPDTGELLRRIAKLGIEASWTPEETREALSEAGVPPDDIATRILQLVTRLKRESKLHWRVKAQTMRQDLLEKVCAKGRAETAELTRPQLLQKLKRAMDRLPTPVAERYAVAFRKFEEATDEDLRSMLDEIAIFEDLEQESR